MERVPEVLQFPIVVEGRRPLAFELQLLEKRDFLRRRRAAEGRILKEPLEPGLLDEGLFGSQLDKLKLLHVSGDQPVIQDDFQRKRREVDVPGRNQRIQERDTVFNGYVEDVRIEELEHDDAHFLVAAAAELRHRPEPRFVLQLLLGQSLDHIQQLLGDQAFQFSERLLLEDHAYVSCRVGLAFPEDQLANFPKHPWDSSLSRPTLDRKKLTIVCSSAKSDEILDIYSTPPRWSQPTVSHQAYCGSKNRRAFYELAEREIGRAARDGKASTVAYCDVDDFKQGERRAPLHRETGGEEPGSASSAGASTSRSRSREFAGAISASLAE